MKKKLFSIILSLILLLSLLIGGCTSGIKPKRVEPLKPIPVAQLAPVRTNQTNRAGWSIFNWKEAKSQAEAAKTNTPPKKVKPLYTPKEMGNYPVMIINGRPEVVELVHPNYTTNPPTPVIVSNAPALTQSTTNAPPNHPYSKASNLTSLLAYYLTMGILLGGCWWWYSRWVSKKPFPKFPKRE